MITNTQMRREQADERISLRNSSQVLTNLIVEGTNCSSFEADVITRKVEEVYCLGEHSDQQVMQPGQMIWNAISATEPAGKPLKACIFHRIVLTVHRLDEDREVHRLHGSSAKRQQQILRMSSEALDQGALLTVEDLATILDTHERTIRKDIKALETSRGILTPTRGNRCDIGPGITHRDKIIEMFLEGKEPVMIARDMQHSLKAVERYIHSYARVVFCHRQLNKDELQVALVVGVSCHLVERCLELHERMKRKPEFRERLEEIERLGTQYWDSQDAKKKPGHNGRRKP